MSAARSRLATVLAGRLLCLQAIRQDHARLVALTGGPTVTVLTRRRVIDRESLIKRMNRDRCDAIELRQIITTAARPGFLEGRAHAQYRADIASDGLAEIESFVAELDELARRAAIGGPSEMARIVLRWAQCRRPIAAMVKALPLEQHWHRHLIMMTRRRALVDVASPDGARSPRLAWW